MPLQSLLNSRFQILVNQSKLPMAVEAYLDSITVEIDRNLPGLFQIEFMGLDFAEVPAHFSPGAIVDIQLGFDQPEQLIKGEILGLEPQFSSVQPPRLTVWGCDSLHRLQWGTKTRTFLNTTDSAIAEKIASEALLVPQTVESPVVHEYVMQANQTDLQFLVQRAQQIGYELFMADETLFFQPILHNTSLLQALTLGQNLLEFHPRFSLMSQATKVTVKGWDIFQKQAITETKNAGKFAQVNDSNLAVRGEVLARRSGAAAAVITDRPVNTSMAQQMAQTQLDQTALELVTAEGTCVGNSQIRPGTMVLIQGLDGQPGGQYSFEGKYYVTGVTHRFDVVQGYLTDFKAKRNAQ
jgi:phage protein D